MSCKYNNKSGQIIIDEVSDEGEITLPTQNNDNESPNRTEEIVLPIISRVYSENPTDQNTIIGGKGFAKDEVAVEVTEEDNDSNFSDSEIELVSVDYTNDTLSDSSEGSNVQMIKRKRRKRGHRPMGSNPCEGKMCRNECNSLTQAEREAIFHRFKMLELQKKKYFVQQWINITIPEQVLDDGKIVTMKAIRDYYFETKDHVPVKVCARFFSATLGISMYVINKYLKYNVKDATKIIEVIEESIVLSTNKSIKIDIVDMIGEIQRKEEIWNQDMPDHHMLDLDAAWREICIALVPNYLQQSIEDQEYLKKKLMEKWSDLKDSYFKYLTKKRTLESMNPRAKPPFMAYRQLLKFLDKTSNFGSGTSTRDCSSEKSAGFATLVIVRNQSDKTASSEPIESETLMCRSSSFAIDDDHLSKKRKLGEESNSYEILSVPYTIENSSLPETPMKDDDGGLCKTQPKSNVSDTNTSKADLVDDEESDLIFFKSLLPIIKTLDQQRKLQFRSDVITNLQKLTIGQAGQDKTVNASPTAQQKKIQQSQSPQAASQNPDVTSTSIPAGMLYTANCSGSSNIAKMRSPYSSVLISSSSDDSDCEC